MIAAIIRLSIANRMIVLAVSLMIALAGVWALRSTAVDAIPDLSDVQVIVKTSYPGQSPQVIEDQVTYPVTTAMLAVPGATDVRGFSFFGDSYLYIVFDEGTDLYWARTRVLEYLGQITSNLPDGVVPQIGPDATGVGWIYQYALTDRTGKNDLAQLRTLQDWFLKYELQTVQGVSEVATIGGMVKQYQVVVDPNKLRAYNVPLSAAKKAIQEANRETGGSVIEMGEAEYMVRSKGYVDELADIADAPLMVNERGAAITLGDVADIRFGPEMRRGVGEFNGEGDAVGGVVILRWGGNALATIKAVEARIEEIRPTLPEGVELVTTYNRSGVIERAVENLWDKLTEELIVVILVCGVFLLHLRSSLVITLSLPLGIFAAFIVMKLQGVNANIMSLGGIAIAIGAMVDAAIVMIEAMHRRIEKEPVTRENRWRIVADCATEVGPALFFSLAIIAVSFLPVFVLESQEGRLFKPLAFTKTYAMAAAAILSITLVPVLMGYLVRGRILPERKNPLNRLVIWLYRPFLDAAVAWPWATSALAVALVVSMAWPLQRIGTEFMPELNEGDLLYMPSLYPGVSIGKAREVLQQTDRLIAAVPEVESVHGKLGRADTATDPAPLTMLETMIQLKPESEWREGMTMESIRRELDRIVQVPGVTNVWIQPIKNRIDMLATGIKSPVGVKVSGPDLSVIEGIGIEVERAVSSVEGTASAYAERPVGGRFVEINVDRKAAARYMMSVREIQDVVQTAIGGLQVSESVEGLERFPINLRYPQEWRDSPEKIRNLPVVTPSGAHIPLGAVAEISIVDGPSMIRSENARPTGFVFIDIAGRDLGGYVEEARARVAEMVTLPPGYSLTWSGQYEYIQRMQDRLTLVAPATLLIITLMLFLAFSRVTEVAIILAALPVALAGGLWLTWYLGFDISVAVLVGFIALAGVAVETAIVMLLYLNVAWKKRVELASAERRDLTGQDIEDVVFEGALLRVRPKVMTVATIFAGLIPVMYSSGTGSEIMQRIAAPMVGGMVTATLLTLLVIPAIFVIWKRFSLPRANRGIAAAGFQLRDGQTIG
ncbi:MAG: CusA/CzcA family heavy metal efflux RND transporter [Pseudophaeobacter sp. bin_em_oilr2.035]|uniref:CusA/CzcA family heavy metal efflux RND transporter n=1 Tax=Phaeobacter gallaeciensis TaxID=60890 RepID=A0ABD4XAL0_9RHOB|nr:CusA/CzcA family heavy metal efflux RND transporter [Phaeobacter gallaeciensis]MDF1771453.1 CusA/CzcA family heavy metal efflux RND transporter [Pseudophaeobacter sp. bin_em_oilr2.035]MDE4145480.1 CusA/CzcA family heavy metal efflux RND transporter [Phaeobacter gallaeciensis]MDE4158151.1 CusA/CzcA family heavy metal efflux RND transporter [Phaeobacter gallaeciensis]MDE4162330.1 CusA/CzcA family heavy metal efflux RND transporter [Phaeobacter gallaeciensis]MDE4166556.1 CusA/CzcA family heavy